MWPRALWSQRIIWIVFAIQSDLVGAHVHRTRNQKPGYPTGGEVFSWSKPVSKTSSKYESIDYTML